MSLQVFFLLQGFVAVALLALGAALLTAAGVCIKALLDALFAAGDRSEAVHARKSS